MPFQKGNTYGNRKGRPKGVPNKVKREVKDRLFELKEDAIQSVIKGIKKGDFQMTKLWFEYSLGKPVQQADLNITNNGLDWLNPVSEISEEEIQESIKHALNGHSGSEEVA